jgi:hypothetical protein
LKHVASAKFWALYAALPVEVRSITDKNYALLKDNPHHPSLHFKKVGPLWSARVGDQYRALGKTLKVVCYGFGSARMRTTIS